MKKTVLYSLLFPFTILASCGMNGTNEKTDQETPVVRNIDEAEALPMVNDSAVITIDVRTRAEVQEGYIDGADLFIDYNGDFQMEIAKLDKTKTYLLYCRSGSRSTKAAEMMEAEGFKTIYLLRGGFSGWNGPVDF